VALPLTRPDVFAQTLQRLLVERLGATPGAEPQVVQRGGVNVGWKVLRGYGMIARGAAPLQRLVEPQQPLSKAPGLATARAQLGAQDFVIWAPKTSELPQRYVKRPLPGDVAVSLQGSAQGIALRLLADAVEAQPALPGGGAALVDLLPSDAPVKARLGLSPQELLSAARKDPDLAALLDQLHGADAEALASVAPGVVLSLGVEKTANIGAMVDSGLDFRRRSPFDTVQLVALAQATDAPRLLKALASIAGALPSLGARVERSGDDFQVTYPAGRGPRFGVRQIDGKPVAYLLGGSLKPEDLKRGARGADALWQDPGASVQADFGKLAAAVAALPESAYGSGPQSYVARSLVSQVVEPLRPLRLKLDAQASPDRLGAVLDLEIAPQ
jgi:hypothetical protein